MIRPFPRLLIGLVLSVWLGLPHYQNYDYEATKTALTGDSDTILESDTSLATANVDIKR